MSKEQDLVYYRYPNFTGIYINREVIDPPPEKKRKKPGKFPDLPPYILPNDRYNTFLKYAKEYRKSHPDLF